ncbi:hypothetical protein AAC387_Pa12g0350 [Persea americana]
MAVSFCNPSLSLAPPRVSAFQTPSKTLFLPRTIIFQDRHRHPHLIRNSNLRSSALSSSSPFFRRSFHSSPQTSESRSKGSEVEKNYPHTLKELIRVYKDAVLHGDEKTVSDIEEMISTIENEKISLVKKVSEIAAEIVSGKDKYLRLKADFDNFRKRSEKDRLTLTSDVQGEGIYKQFVEILRSLRVAVVQTVGNPFDPSLHEAIGREESQEFNEGIIIEEIRRGFVLGERLLRPATVKVSSGRKRAPPNAERPTGKPPAAVGTDEGSAPRCDARAIGPSNCHWWRIPGDPCTTQSSGHVWARYVHVT